MILAQVSQMRALLKGIAVGVAVGVLCFVLGLIGEGIIAARSAHRSKVVAPLNGRAAVSPGDKADEFYVSTTDEVISSESVSRDIRYLLPSSVAIMIVTAAWAYRRSRSA